MNYELVALIVSLTVLIFFMVYTLIYNRRFHHPKILTSEIVQEIPEDVDTLEDHFKEEEMADVREKIAAIDALLPESALEQMEESPLKIQKDEQILIDEGARMYETFQAELRPATPESEDQKEQDLLDLKAAIAKLEKMNPEQFPAESEEEDKMAKGMLYDNISQRLKRILKENQWDQWLFIQAEKLESAAFAKIKHLEHAEFMETLKVMQEIGTIHNLIEINPETNLFFFTKEVIPFTLAQKVIIALFAENPAVTGDIIKRITGWSGTYLNENLQFLEEKKIMTRDNQQLMIVGLISEEEKRTLQQKLITVEQKKLEKEKDALKIQEERKAKEKEFKEKKRQEEQQALIAHTRQEAQLKSEKIKSQIDAKEADKKDKLNSDEILDDMEDLENLVHQMEEAEQNGNGPALDLPPPEMDIPIPPDMSSAEGTGSEASDPDEYQNEVMIIQSVFNDIEGMTGGIVILQGLLWYLNQGEFPEMKKSELMLILDHMKERNLIFHEYNFSGVNIYVFKNIAITQDMEEIIRQFAVYGEMDVEDIQTAIEWEAERLNEVLHKLWDQGLMQMKENEKYYIPGLFNTQ